MRKYNYILIEKDNESRSSIIYFLKDVANLEHKISFSSIKDGQEYFEKNKIDILFLNIDDEEIDSIDFLKSIHNKIKILVIISSSEKIPIEIVSLKLFSYIKKPVTKENVDFCLQQLMYKLNIVYKANSFDQTFKNDNIFIKSGNTYVSIHPYKILFLEAAKDYTKIHTFDGESYLIYGNLSKSLRNKLFQDLMRIHKSYAIQQKYVKSLNTKEIQLANNVKLPLGPKYRQIVLEKIKENILD